MFNFFELLSQKGIDIRENASSQDEYRICCLFCVDMGYTPDFKFRLGFNVQSGLGHCFNCGWSSRKVIIEILKKLGEGYQEVTTENYTKQTRKRPEPVKLPEGFELLADTDEDDPMFGEARRYVAKRGITENQLKKHLIGATVADYRYKNSIIFPVPMADGKLAGIVSRDYTGKRDPKYLNSIGTKVIYNVFGDYSEVAVILSEGITKALAIERAVGEGICSGATLGHSITDTQIEGLKKFREVILFPDPDYAGLVGFIGVAANLRPVVRKVTMAWPWPQRQADDLSVKEIREHLRNRKEFTPAVQLRLKMELRGRG
jgi:DNA primase